MSAFSDDDLIDYALGESSPDSADAIRAASNADPELAATLELLGHCAGMKHESPKFATNAGQHRPAPWLRRAAIAAALVLVVGGLSWAGWTLLSEKPLLADDFDSNWGDHSKWRTPRPSVKVENGHLRLFDRGFLVSLQEFPEPIDLTFRWRWTDLAGSFLYRDELSVALRTSGTPRSQHSFEVADGVILKLNCTGGTINIYKADNLESPVLGMGMAFLPLPAEQWQTVRITDDGETISVYILDPPLRHDVGRTPDVTVKVTGSFPNHRIAFYNRERLAAASHESWLDDVVVRKLHPSP